MKKIISLFLGIIIIFSFIGCNSTNSEEITVSSQPSQTEKITNTPIPEPSEETTSTPTEEIVPIPTEVKSETINFKDADNRTLVYTKHEIVKDYQGKPALAIYFDYTNNADDTKAAMYLFSVKPFQDGVECSPAILTDSAEEYQNTLKEIKTGKTLPVCWYFSLTNETKNVELEVTSLLDFTGTNKSTQLLILDTNKVVLPSNEGKEKKEETKKKTSKKKEIIDLTIDDSSNLIYTKHEIVKDYQGKPALAVYFNFTNNSNQAQSYIYTFGVKAFQDGVECPSALMSAPSNEYQNTMKQVKTGTTLSVCWYYSLNDEKTEVTLEAGKVISYGNEEKSTQVIKLK